MKTVSTQPVTMTKTETDDKQGNENDQPQYITNPNEDTMLETFFSKFLRGTGGYLSTYQTEDVR